MSASMKRRRAAQPQQAAAVPYLIERSARGGLDRCVGWGGSAGVQSHQNDHDCASRSGGAYSAMVG